MSPLAFRLTVAAGITGALVSLTLVATKSIQYKPYGVHDLQRPQWDAIQMQVAATAEASRAAAVANAQNLPSSTAGKADVAKVVTPRPIAVTEKLDYDFGTLDAGAQSSHTFTIRNEGTLPLIVSAGDTSCKCTVSKASKDVVEPGDDATVTLTWNTGTSRKFYRQYAVVKTNDPQRREIEFGVSGQIRTHVGFDVEASLSKTVDPGQPVPTSWIVFTQSMERFDIDSIECGLPGFRYETSEISDAEMDELQATYGLRVNAQTDPLMNSGRINETIRVLVRPAPEETDSELQDELVVRELGLQVHVESPISFYGANLHQDDGLDLGTTFQGTEKVSKMMIRVRGDSPPETMVVKHISPSILKAEIEPSSGKAGTYKLTVRVPKDAPQTIFNIDGHVGRIEIADPQQPHLTAAFPIIGKVLVPAKK